MTLGIDHAFYGSTGLGICRFDTTGKISYIGSFPAFFMIENVIMALDGSLYGAISFNGSRPPSIFKMTSSGVFSYTYAFPSTMGNSQSLTLGPNGKLYGIYEQGNHSGIFAYSPDSNSITIAHEFSAISEGSYGTSALTLGPDGKLYGTTGTTAGSGIVYRFDVASSQFQLLCSAPAQIIGGDRTVSPVFPLTFSKARQLYGAVPNGGDHQAGQIFRVE